MKENGIGGMRRGGEGGGGCSEHHAPGSQMSMIEEVIWAPVAGSALVGTKGKGVENGNGLWRALHAVARALGIARTGTSARSV